MDVALWIIQGLLAAFFLGSGLTKLTEPRAKLAAEQMPYMEDLTDRQARGVGALEALAAIGLTLPAALHIIPILTAVAASGVALLMLGAMRIHLRRREVEVLPVNLVLACLALLVAVMRF
jgi:uncharacterized membrane protein YphA (DoxX/SURF4 family)